MKVMKPLKPLSMKPVSMKPVARPSTTTLATRAAYRPVALRGYPPDRIYPRPSNRTREDRFMNAAISLGVLAIGIGLVGGLLGGNR
jgi:hypothetical protein